MPRLRARTLMHFDSRAHWQVIQDKLSSSHPLVFFFIFLLILIIVSFSYKKRNEMAKSSILIFQKFDKIDLSRGPGFIHKIIINFYIH